MVRATSASALYLCLPPRAGGQRPREVNAAVTALPQVSLGFAWTLRAQLQRADTTTLARIAPLVAQASRVVLLLAASDVTLLRMPVPPLSASRLQAALPGLIEDRVIGDPEDCVIAAGPDVDGQRTIAVADRAWLQAWLQVLRQFGARRIAALPMQLCLPLPAGRASAALLDLSGTLELAMRTSPEQGLGMAVDADGPDALVDAVRGMLAAFGSGRAVQLSVTPRHAALFQAWRVAHPDSGIELVEEDWSVWIEGASRAGIDLVVAVAANPGERIDWRRWRWPLSLALACLLLNVFALNWDWWRLRSEGQTLGDDMAALYRRSFPGTPLTQAPLAQMQQKIAAARQAAGEFAAGDFLALAAALGEAWSEAGNDLRAISSLDYRDATLNVRLRPGAQASLEALGPALAARRLAVAPSPADPLLWQVRSTP